MVALPQSYNPNEIEASTGGGSVPAGEYKVQVASSEAKETKSGNGSYLEVVYLITQGEYQNMKIWDRFNIENPNPQAVEIGLKQFKQLAEACGKPNCTDSDDLHGKNFICVMGPQKSDPTKMEVKNRVGSSVPSGTTKAASTTTTSSADTSGKKKPSWA